MKYLSAIILVAVLLTLPGASVFAAPGPTVDAGLAAEPAGTGVYPTFVITAVSQNNWVEIRTDNLPANENFTVTMGYMGSGGFGTVVATTYSNTGGSIVARYTIPAYLYNQGQIAIRMVGQSSGYFAYNWFYNNNANVAGPAPAPSAPAYVGYPSFAIAAVQQDKNVTIAPSNFPPNETFWVRLNWMHTQGLAGYIVQTVHTDANGVLDDMVYPIPDFLKGSYQIAVRLESPNYPYYFAYNWFYNNNAP
ncbi:MAG: hypothetical protein H8E28_12060 [Anaerolineae bacterium]|nr:hypothetical protein [Anaerolineae bacterium]